MRANRSSEDIYLSRTHIIEPVGSNKIRFDFHPIRTMIK